MRAVRALVIAVAISTGVVGGSTSAFAASCSAAETSEMTRLRGELSKLAGKNAHSGVISTFNKMLDLTKQKCELKPDDYKLAANSARNLGDIDTAIDWFKSAGATTDSKDLETRFGQVKIAEKAGELTKDGGMPFAPDERAALDSAATSVKANGKFSGYLPVGTYKLGVKSFEVKASGVTKV